MMNSPAMYIRSVGISKQNHPPSGKGNTAVGNSSSGTPNFFNPSDKRYFNSLTRPIRDPNSNPILLAQVTGGFGRPPRTKSQSTTVDGVTYYDVIFYDNGKLKQGTLNREAKVQGVECAAGGPIHFYENGQIKSAKLVEPEKGSFSGIVVVQKIFCRRGTPVEFHPNGKLKQAMLEMDQTIQGVECLRGSVVSFYENGNLESVSRIETQSIGREGSRASLGSRTPVYFHENGGLKEGTIAFDQKIKGVSFSEGMRVHFSENGKLLVKQELFEGRKYREGSVTKHANGKLESAILMGDQAIQGIRLKDGSRVQFNEQGKLGQVALAKKQLVKGLLCEGTVTFHESGKIRYATLPGRHRIQGVSCGDGAGVSFYANGKLESCDSIASSQTLHGVGLPSGSGVSFNEKGKLVEIEIDSERDVFIQWFWCKRRIDLKSGGWWAHCTVQFDEKGFAYSSEGEIKLGANKRIQGIDCASGTSVEFSEDGELMSATLSRAQNIKGVSLSAGSEIWFNEKGGVREAKLAQPQVISGIRFSKGASVSFDENGKLKGPEVFSISSGEVKLHKGSAQNYPQGGLKQGKLYLDLELNGILFQGGENIHFHENGNVAKGILAKNQELKGTKLERGLRVEFDKEGFLSLVGAPEEAKDYDDFNKRITVGRISYEVRPDYDLDFYQDGSVKSGALSKTHEIQGMKLEESTRVSFYENGKLKGINLPPGGKAREIQGVKCEEYTKVEFHENGKLHRATLAEEKEIQEIKLGKGDQVTFDEEGTLMQVFLYGERKIKDLKFQRGFVGFFKSGQLKGGTLAGGQVIQGMKCSGDISFYEGGQIKEATLTGEQEIQGLRCGPYSASAAFYESGKLREAKRCEGTVQGVPCSPKGFIRFYENGQLQEGSLERDEAIQGIKCNGDSHFPSKISFHENGKLKEAELSEDQEIQGMKFKAYGTVHFDEQGRPQQRAGTPK